MTRIARLLSVAVCINGLMNETQLYMYVLYVGKNKDGLLYSFAE